MVYQSRWKPEDKIRIVESVNTSISISELCRKYGVVPNTFYQWKEKFLEAGKSSASPEVSRTAARAGSSRTRTND